MEVVVNGLFVVVLVAVIKTTLTHMRPKIWEHSISYIFCSTWNWTERFISRHEKQFIKKIAQPLCKISDVGPEPESSVLTF